MKWNETTSCGACVTAVVIGTALTCAIRAGAAEPASQTITVREQLNQTYGREMVAYPFSAKDGSCVADSIQLAAPSGPLPAQLSDVEYWPGKARYVKSGRLCFVVESLKPLTAATYALTYGKKSATATAGDLQVKADKDRAEITTSLIGIRLPLGSGTFAAPVSAKDVPGPVAGMRLGSGAWAGGSALTGDVKVLAWKAELAASGPVLARGVVTYTFEDSNVVTLAASVLAGDNTVRWEMTSREDRPALGFELRLPPVPGVKQAVLAKGYGQWAKADRTLDLKPGPEPFAFLSPDSSVVNIFPDCPPNIRLAPAAGGGAELQIRSRDPSAWSDPVAPLTYGGARIWELDGIPKSWDAWKRKRVPVCYSADGVVTLQASFARGARKWWTGAGAAAVGDQLDSVKDMVLDWPADPKRPQPRLFVGMPEIKDAWARAAADPEFAKFLTGGGDWATAVMPVLMEPAAERKPQDAERVVKPLRDQLALMGNFDVMRSAIRTVTLYDVLIESDLLTPADKALFRAQMAYLGYLMADPRCWSMERGYHSGNPNMSSSYTLSLGVIACALSDHPAAKAWADYATQWMDKWLTDEVGPNGEWMPEGSHYSYVSLEPMVSYAIAAKRAGYHDFSNDPRFKKLLLYFAKFNTARDVRRRTVNGVQTGEGLRSIGAYGRGHGGCMAVFGSAAPFFKATDPAFAGVMQWIWNESGSTLYMGDGRLGGMEPYYVDRRLPATPPAWGSELFPGLGAILRAGFSTPNESFLTALMSVQSLRNLDVWTPEVGGIAQWFGRGKPLSTCFTFAIGYNERHELLRNGVRLARNWGAPGDPKGPFGHYTDTRFSAFAALPSADYVESMFVNTRVDDRDWFPDNVPAFPKVTPAQGTNLTWTRQLLFGKDPDPAGPAWLAVRDTTSGKQPTAWQFWTLSEKVGTPDQVRDAATFLADKPGQTNLPARELPMGDRYTALGQFDVDVDYFIASPAATPRHTLRYGGKWAGNQIPEYQDLLHLQQPGDGAYYVAVYPRPRGEAAPTFAKLAGDAILKAAGAAGTDYAFLASAETTAAAEGVSFKGTAGAVQQRPGGTTLSLAAAGEVRFNEFGIAGPAAAALQVTPGALDIHLPADTTGGEFTLTAPAGWKLKSAPAGVKLDAANGAYRLSVPKGIPRVTLTR